MALLRLSSPVTFTDFIQPVCLAAEGSTFNSDTMWVTGWGTINSGGKKQDNVLMHPRRRLRSDAFQFIVNVGF